MVSIYKLIAADIDGTLLNSASEMTEKTKKTIGLAVEKGVIFTLSTGRPMQGVEYINRMFKEDMPLILYNGARVVTGKTKRKLFEQSLSAQCAKEIINTGIELNTTVIIWADDKLYVTEFNERTEKYTRISNVQPMLAENAVSLVEKGVTKILWYDEIDNINKYQEEMSLRFAGKINCHTSRPMFLEFVDVNASKAAAMEEIGRCYGIKREEMIAVGDGFNDLSMIEYAGLGVAMANAAPPVKEKADFTTLSNDDDGVAHVIEKFILGGTRFES